ncbi:MAG TPA: hypothetical protein PLR50_14950, partial [Candidatus Rifleibacterium sp.]|nr:hypothetical protein [Candidatus Rifleibacterium sp.]
MKLTRAGFKTAFLLLVLTFILNLAAFAAQSDAKALFDRYQAVYKSYREAVENQADAAEVSQLAAELQAACKEYYNSIGVTASFSSDDQAEPVLSSDTETRGSDSSTAT